MCSKKLIYFNGPTWSKLLFAVSATNLLCHISFSASIRLMLSCGKPELPTTIINIITSKPRGPYLPLF